VRMVHDETLILIRSPDSAREAAEARFTTIVVELTSMLPSSAEILHVGATAVPGCLTKGDLDIAVRVDRHDFAATEAVLAKRFSRNTGSVRTDEFAAFESSDRQIHVGVQLTVKGGAFDVFHHLAEKLRKDPALMRRYNDLKLRFSDKPMKDYRAAKHTFIAEVLSKRGSSTS
jgi:GrpB-like predicted nucleotidyltransferase (UPF0157 family)